MNHTQFKQLLEQGPILLDGATGTHLQTAGMPTGVCPEIWVTEHPEVLQDLQSAYFNAGSQIIYTFTFGANRPKLSHYQLNTDVESFNGRVAAISTSVRDQFRRSDPQRTFLVAGEMGPTGRFLFPAGDLSLAELIEIYREQVRGHLTAGVDLFVVETMMDLAETRAAVLAVQAECDLPIMASLTFADNGRTLSGNSPLECLLTLAGLGVAACGINCSFGPEKLGELIEPLRAISPIPLLLKPNAGLPQLIEGQTVFPMDPAAFAFVMKPLAHGCVLLLGGCCGTGPNHIASLAHLLKMGLAEQSGLSADVLPPMICSSRQNWLVENAEALPVIECCDPDNLIDDVYDALDNEPPAVILDFDNAVIKENLPLWLESLQQLQVMMATPLIFRTADSELLEQLLHHYCGRAGIIGATPAKAYGALII